MSRQDSAESRRGERGSAERRSASGLLTRQMLTKGKTLEGESEPKTKLPPLIRKLEQAVQHENENAGFDVLLDDCVSFFRGCVCVMEQSVESEEEPPLVSTLTL